LNIISVNIVMNRTKQKEDKINVPKIPEDDKSKTNIIANPSLRIDNPSVDLRYLHKSKTCLKKVGWSLKNDRVKFDEFFNGFQKFIADFSDCKNISEASKRYSSHINGSTKELIENKSVKDMLNCLPSPVTEYARTEITHFHLKRNGMGEAVLFGFIKDNSFHVIGIDVDHTVLN